MSTFDNVRPYAKAVVGFLAPGVVALAAAVQDGSAAGSTVTGGEWLTAVAACLVTGGAVFGVPNTAPRGVSEQVAQDVHPDDLDHDSDLPVGVTP